MAVDDFFYQLDSGANSLHVLDNDGHYDGDSVTIVAVGSPASGSVQISGNHLLYTPDDVGNVSDEFSYTIEDSQGNQATAYVSIESWSYDWEYDDPEDYDWYEVSTADAGSNRNLRRWRSPA